MLRIVQEQSEDRNCEGLRRRELLRFGALSGLAAAGRTASAGRRKARSFLFISLFGGPSHQDIWDMKPEAPAEVRGEFKPIPTSVPGIQITEHLPKLARLAHRYSLVRSVTHEDNGHGSAMYAAFAGLPHRFPNTNPIPSVEDWPAYGSMLARLRGAPAGIPPFVVVGGTQFVCGNQIPGQRAGWLGPSYEPFVIAGDPGRPGFRVPELTPIPELNELRVGRRRQLLEEVEAVVRQRDAVSGESAGGYDAVRTRAFDLLGSQSVRTALDLKLEPEASRARFGKSTFGQSLVLGRRLIEAGVPCVSVNWSTGGPWDTHGNNFPALRDSLLPAFDLTFSALLNDLQERGLLEETVILCTGEFGRTPKVNPGAGRDHWAGVYTSVLAGGGIQGGRVHGTSDAHAAYPKDEAVGPWDLAATVYHCLGVDRDTEVLDRSARPMKICRGEPITSLL